MSKLGRTILVLTTDATPIVGFVTNDRGPHDLEHADGSRTSVEAVDVHALVGGVVRQFTALDVFASESDARARQLELTVTTTDAGMVTVVYDGRGTSVAYELLEEGQDPPVSTTRPYVSAADQELPAPAPVQIAAPPAGNVAANDPTPAAAPAEQPAASELSAAQPPVPVDPGA